jgi:hypothetical protein
MLEQRPVAAPHLGEQATTRKLVSVLRSVRSEWASLEAHADLKRRAAVEA